MINTYLTAESILINFMHSSMNKKFEIRFCIKFLKYFERNEKKTSKLHLIDSLFNLDFLLCRCHTKLFNYSSASSQHYSKKINLIIVLWSTLFTGLKDILTFILGLEFKLSMLLLRNSKCILFGGQILFEYFFWERKIFQWQKRKSRCKCACEFTDKTKIFSTCKLYYNNE